MQQIILYASVPKIHHLRPNCTEIADFGQRCHSLDRFCWSNWRPNVPSIPIMHLVIRRPIRTDCARRALDLKQQQQYYFLTWQSYSL